MSDDKLARALGSKIRRDIIHFLLKTDLTVHEIATQVKISEVNASKHLKKLFDLGLLNSWTEGRERYYSIKIKEIKGLISEYDNVVRILGKTK